MSKLKDELRDNYIRELSKRLGKESKERGVAVGEFKKELRKRLNEEPLEQFTKKEINALKSRVAKLASEVVEQKLLQEITKIVLDKVLPELDRVRMKKEVSHDHKTETLRPDKLFPTYCSLRTAQIKEDQITDLVHDATKIQNKTVDDSAIANNKILTYKTASGNIEYDSKTASGDIDHGLVTGLADDDHTVYVPVDGVARQLADAGYPNALLKDGSRAKTTTSLRVVSYATQAISNTSMTKRNFTTTSHDRNSEFDMGNDNFTVSVAGIYFVVGAISLTDLPDGSIIIVSIHLNNVRTAESRFTVGATAIAGANVAVILDLAVDDVIDIRIYQNSGG